VIVRETRRLCVEVEECKPKKGEKKRMNRNEKKEGRANQREIGNDRTSAVDASYLLAAGQHC
jgi:hypothetical protein